MTDNVKSESLTYFPVSVKFPELNKITKFTEIVHHE